MAPASGDRRKPAAERITQMTDGKVTAASGQENSPLRWAVIRTDRGRTRSGADSFLSKYPERERLTLRRPARNLLR
jgi:hypothetical protein